MKKNAAEELTVTFIIVLIVLLIGACERRQWNECLRVHPWWYCMEVK